VKLVSAGAGRWPVWKLDASAGVQTIASQDNFLDCCSLFVHFSLPKKAVSVASQKHAAMKLNIANPSTGQMKVISPSSPLAQALHSTIYLQSARSDTLTRSSSAMTTGS
jgi:hypothetical protein